MCGIIGLLAKSETLRDSLGRCVTPMIECMGSRGPDSAGLAVFHEPLDTPQRRFALYAPDRCYDWQSLEDDLLQGSGIAGELHAVENHAAVSSQIDVADFKSWLSRSRPEVHLLSVGRSIDVYKDEGHPRDISRRYGFSKLEGTHAVGHTRMATESAVSPAHAHPFTAGEDFCLVHNGSLSNPHSVRRKLERKGITFETDNDAEAGCRFLEWRMSEGDSLCDALERAFGELDGFYTFLMATTDSLVLVRDGFACKPAVVAETDDYVAVSSEFRSLAHLPDIQDADVFEPAPQQIYSWTV